MFARLVGTIEARIEILLSHSQCMSSRSLGPQNHSGWLYEEGGLAVCRPKATLARGSLMTVVQQRPDINCSKAPLERWVGLCHAKGSLVRVHFDYHLVAKRQASIIWHTFHRFKQGIEGGACRLVSGIASRHECLEDQAFVAKVIGSDVAIR